MQYIIRNTHENYTAMNNHFLQDPNLSSSAKGVLAVILSNKDDWRIYPDEIAKRSKDGLVSHRTAFEELEKHGYIRTVKKSLGRGKGIQHYRFAQDIPIALERRILEPLMSVLTDTRTSQESKENVTNLLVTQSLTGITKTGQEQAVYCE